MRSQISRPGTSSVGTPQQNAGNICILKRCMKVHVLNVHRNNKVSLGKEGNDRYSAFHVELLLSKILNLNSKMGQIPTLCIETN